MSKYEEASDGIRPSCPPPSPVLEGEASTELEWLLEANGDVIEPDAVDVVTEGSRIRFCRYEPSPGLQVFTMSAEAEREVHIEGHVSDADPRVFSVVHLDGSIRIRLPDGASVSVNRTSSPLYIPRENRGTLEIPPQPLVRIVGFSIPVDRLVDWFASEPRISGLLSGGEPAKTFEVRPSPALRELAASLFKVKLNGPLQRLFLEGLALQVFALHIEAIGLDEVRPAKSLSTAEKHGIRWARKRLVGDLTAPPSAKSIAGELGISVARLNSGFRALYGLSISQFVRNERLERARRTLEAESLPIHKVAERAGYRHVSNFTTAFARRYGSPPHQFRREQHLVTRTPEGRGVD